MFFAIVEEKKHTCEVIKTGNANSAMQQNKIVRIEINEALYTTRALYDVT